MKRSCEYSSRSVAMSGIHREVHPRSVRTRLQRLFSGSRHRADQGAHLADLIRSDAARPLRFGLSGGVSGLLQLALLAKLTHAGWAPLSANGVAFIVAAQVNFAVNWVFTWRDRHADGSQVRSFLQRWAMFHGAVAGTACLNMLVFTLARLAVPPLPAAALGIASAAGVNYMLGDRLVFRARSEGRFRSAMPVWISLGGLSRPTRQ